MKKKKVEIEGTHIAKDENNPLPNYTIVKYIGEGTFGKVHIAIHNPTQEKVAVKVLEKDKITEEEDIERINREIKFLKKFKNINIIKIYEVIETSKSVYFIMEYAPGGELFNYIVKKKYLDEKEASFFFIQIIHALDFIHKHQIAHRDVKPENMLLTENNTIKMIDFGLSNQYNKGSMLKTPCGSPCYAAPEMLLVRKYAGSHVDIWSAGITLYAMVCGYLPFEDPNNEKLYKKIVECKLEFPSVNPQKRITFEEIKSHPFYKLSNTLINKSNFGLYLNQVDAFVLDKMVELGFNKDTVIKEVEANNHNNNTTTYELLLNKYKGVGEVTNNAKNFEKKDKKKDVKIKDKLTKKELAEREEEQRLLEEKLKREEEEKRQREEELKKKIEKIKKEKELEKQRKKQFTPLELFEMEKKNFILKYYFNLEIL